MSSASGFRGTVAGEQTVIDAIAHGLDDARQVGPDVPAAEVLHLYRQEIELADAIITSTRLDAGLAWWPGELIDGRKCLVLTE